MRLRSNSKWRRMSGSVPRPIEPKPIITIGPSIVAWMGQSRMMLPLNERGRPRAATPQEQKARRLVNRRAADAAVASTRAAQATSCALGISSS